MNFIDLFPTVILQENLNFSNSELDSFKQTILSENFIKRPLNGDYTKNQRVLTNPIFQKLESNLIKLSEIYLDNIGHSYESLQIASSWGTFFEKDDSTSFHSHKNSYISGVFYIKGGSDIVFNNPLEDLYYFNPNYNQNPKVNSYRTYLTYSYTPAPNNVLIFPSFLKHAIKPSLVNERISIAFNIIPKGEFGFDTAKMYL